MAEKMSLKTTARKPLWDWHEMIAGGGG